jgi:hypothetical protein
MSLYITSPFKPTPKLLVQGTPEYLFGSFTTDVAPTQGTVISDSGNGTTSTVTFQILSGNIPKPDALITIVGTANAAGAYNVTNAPILTVSASANPDAGVYTVTFLGTGTSATAGDYGQVIIPQSEVGDVVTPAGAVVSSAPVVSPVAGPNSVGKSLSVTVKLPASTAANPSTLAAVTVVLQGSNVDLDSEYNTVATVTPAALVAGSSTVDWQSGQGDPTAPSNSLAAGNVTLLNFRFYRAQVSTGASGSGPIIVKIMQ